MIDDKIKPAAGIDPIAPAASIPQSRFNGGLEPGSLHGQSRPMSRVPEDPHEDVIAQVKGMDGKEMHRWLKIPGNREKLDAAYAAKGKRL